MAAKVPIRTVYTGSTATGLAEFQSGEFLAYSVGGTGLTALGTAGQALVVNGAGNAIEWGTPGDITGVTAGTGLSGGGTSGTVTVAIDSTVTTLTGTQTLTNKSFNQVDILAQGDIRLQDTTGGQYVALQAPGTVSTSWTATLPAAVGSSGQALRTSDGSGTLEWFTPETGDLTAITAGAGLTGGGNSGAVTLDVVGGTGITANANDIAIDSTVTTLTGTQTLANKTLTAPTITGTAVMATLDISGDVDVDGTLETDALTIGGVTIAETIADTVGAMVGSNTETGIAVTYEDGDNTLDFVLGAAQTTITSLFATDIKIGEDDQTKIDFETADEIHFYAANTEQVYVADNIFGPQSDSDVDLGTTGVRWKDAYIDTITTTGNTTIGGNLTVTGDYTVNGDTTTVNTATLSVEDPLIIMASGNNAADSVDIGLYGLYDTSGSQDLYSGLFRDASDSGKWKLFKDLQAAPTTTVNTSGTGYAVGTFVANLEGAVTGNATTATALATGRTIGMTGDVVWTSASFDGSGNVTAAATIQAQSVENSMLADDAVGADELASNAVVNASIASGAAIDATKIADGSVTSAEFQYINSLSSNAQTQLDTKATKGFSIAMGVALG